jgi:hypothetical protein
VRRARDQKREVQKMFDALQILNHDPSLSSQESPAVSSIQSFSRSLAVVSSRAFEGFRQEHGTSCLVPLLDLCNHGRGASFTAPRSNLSYRWDEDRSALVVRAKTRLAGGDALVITYGAQGNAAHTGSVSSRTSSPTGPAMMCISCWWTSTHSETLRRTFAHFAFEDHSTMRWASGVYSCRKLLKIGPTFKRGGWFIRLPPKSPSNDATAPVTTRQPQYRD